MASEMHGASTISEETREEIRKQKRTVAFMAKALIVVVIHKKCEWIQKHTKIPAANWMYEIMEFMNAQQRRKERRKKESSRKYSVGDRVRIHHKHQEEYNTMTSQKVVSYGWSEKVKAMLYQLDQSLGSDFQEGDLVPDTTERRRQNLKL